MLKRRIIATVIVGASLTLASFAILHARSSGPSQSAQLAVTTPEGTPPPFPAAVVNAPAPPSGQLIQTGPFTRPDRCTQQSTHQIVGVDYIAKETTVSQLAANTDQIVVADAVRQVAYWKTNGDNWSPMTMTEYHVTQVIKGTVGAWLQISEAGASSDLIPSCKSLAYIIANEPVATLNQRYVLFLKLNPETGQLDTDPMRWFPVIGGRVYTVAAQHPAASGSVVWNFHPEPLDSFLAALRIG